MSVFSSPTRGTILGAATAAGETTFDGMKFELEFASGDAIIEEVIFIGVFMQNRYLHQQSVCLQCDKK